jgi:conjugal transfer ATP-binding protein TraC
MDNKYQSLAQQKLDDRKIKEEVSSTRETRSSLGKHEVIVDDPELKKKNPLEALLEKAKNLNPKTKSPEEEAKRLEEQRKKEQGNELTQIEGMTVEDIIAPLELEVDFHHMEINGNFYRTLFVKGYPRFVGPNWLSPIINFEHSLRISTYYYPVDSQEILKKLKRKIGEMEATLYGYIEDRKVPDPTLKVALTDAQQLQDAIAEGVSKFFHFSMYITLSATSKERLEKITQNAIATLGAMSVTAKPAVLQQEQGLISTQPLGLDKLYITRNMDTTSIATTFPFVTSDLTMDHGIMYGINLHNKSLIVFERFDMENANTVIFAKSGAGKSYFVKLEAIRSLMLGAEIIVIDPENEFDLLAKAVNGAYISFSQDAGHKMNPFELSGVVAQDEEDELRMKILSLQGFLKLLLGNVTAIDQAILDRALLLTYREKGITLDPATQRTNTPPLLEDLYKVLKGMSEPEARPMASRLERYIIGSGAGIFNEASNVELNNPFTVFSIRDLQDEIRPMAMYLILEYIWTKIKKDRKKRILIIEEAWFMMLHEDSAKFLYSIAKRARKYHLGVTTVTQDVDDFLKNEMGRAIIANSSMQLLFQQSPTGMKRLKPAFNLTQGETDFLLHCDIGQAIFFAGSNHVAMQVVSSKAEHELVTTNPKDLERMKREKGRVRTLEEESEIYEPPVMQGSTKATTKFKTNEKLKGEVGYKRKEMDQMIEEKLKFQEAEKEQTAYNLTDQIAMEREKLQKNSAHINTQGEIKYKHQEDDDEQPNNTH